MKCDDAVTTTAERVHKWVFLNMTTTAFDDQFTAEPEHVTHRPYDTAAILRKNVADLERELQRQRERHAAATARLRDQIERLTSEWERAEAELKAAREQEPVAWMLECQQWTGDTAWLLSWSKSGAGQCNRLEGESHQRALYTHPIPAPAPAVPEEWLKCWLIERPASSEWPAIWLTITTDGRRWVSDGGTMYASGGDWYFTTAAVEALKFADKESADEYVRHGKIKDVVVTEHIFDDRSLLANFKAPVIPEPAVPDEWRDVMAELAADLQASIEAEHAYRNQYSSVMRKYQNDMRIVERARALLQSGGRK